MLNLVSQYRSGHLMGSSWEGDLAGAEHATFDVGVFVSAWEERCIAVTNLGMAVKYAGILSFEHDNGIGIEESYDRALRTYVTEIAENVAPPIQSHVNHLEELSEGLIRLVETAVEALGRPVSVFMDITCCPKYYSLEFLGSCLRRGLCSEMRFLYAGAKYQERDEDSQEKRYEFTSGKWAPVALPSFHGTYDPENRRSFLVSLGFEVESVKEFLSEYTPQRLTFLLPYPGLYPKYTEYAEQVNAELITEFSLPRTRPVKAPAADAIRVWQLLEEEPVDGSDENVTYLSFGPKPHALGMALRALTHPKVQIVYIRPQYFKRRDDKFSGRAWLYDIQDLSLLR